MSKVWGEAYRTTIVCIDSWEGDVPIGRFYNPYLPNGRDFRSLAQFLQEMELALDSMDYPSSFTTQRTFHPTDQTSRTSAVGSPTGAVATFALRILFRQNGSWQGSVTWLEGEKEESFRSVLELVFLLSSALSAREVQR